MIIDTAQLKRRYLQRIAGARDRKVYIGPETVVLEISNSCNLRCRHCGLHAPGNPAHFEKALFFPWEKFLGVVRDCVDLNVDQVHITGSGEPTMHPLFRDMMRHLEQQPLKVRLYTNATFPLAYCSDVIKADHVVVDLNSVDRQQYRELHGKDLFDRVVKNIKRLVSLRDILKPGFVIEIDCVVNAVNIKYKKKMQELASQLGITGVSFSKMHGHAYNQDIILPEGTAESEGKITPPACLNGWFYLKIRLDGSVGACCRNQQMNIGNLEKGSLKELWLSKHMMNMRLLGKYGRILKMFKACQTCTYYDDNVQRLQALAGV
jgi:MoaA/NifB/PqqE/SkfB family radical SAM enzyme